MNIEQALNVLRPSGNTENDLKTAYRQACKKYHPDINPNGLELMKIVNAAYAFLKKHMNKWNFNQQTNDTSLTEKMQAIFNKIKHFEGLKAEVCGAWLWLSGNTYEYKSQLKEYGFKWAPKKKQWYWHDGSYRKKSKRVLEMSEIRALYGSEELETEPLKAIG